MILVGYNSDRVLKTEKQYLKKNLQDFKRSFVTLNIILGIIKCVFDYNLNMVNKYIKNINCKDLLDSFFIMRYQESKSLPESYIKPSECCFTLKWFHAIIILVENFDGMKLFLIGGMKDLNFNYCYKITYESGETYDRRRNELSVEISKEDYKKIITGVLQERPIEQIEGISDVIDKIVDGNFRWQYKDFVACL